MVVRMVMPMVKMMAWSCGRSRVCVCVSESACACACARVQLCVREYTCDECACAHTIFGAPTLNMIGPSLFDNLSRSGTVPLSQVVIGGVCLPHEAAKRDHDQ